MEYEIYQRYKYLSCNLLNLRKRYRMDQIAFAEKCGLSRHQYMRAEGGHRSVTLQTLLTICQRCEIDMGDLFKIPFDDALRIQVREKVQTRSAAGATALEEKYVSHLNRKTIVKRLTLRAGQPRKFKLIERLCCEIVAISGEVIFSSRYDSKVLNPGEHLAVDFDPALSFEDKPHIAYKLVSKRGATVLLIQTLAD